MTKEPDWNLIDQQFPQYVGYYKVIIDLELKKVLRGSQRDGKPFRDENIKIFVKNLELEYTHHNKISPYYTLKSYETFSICFFTSREEYVMFMMKYA